MKARCGLMLEMGLNRKADPLSLASWLLHLLRQI